MVVKEISIDVSKGCMSRSHPAELSSATTVERDDDVVEDEWDDNDEEDEDDECDDNEARPVPDASSRGKCRPVMTLSIDISSMAPVS